MLTDTWEHRQTIGRSCSDAALDALTELGFTAKPVGVEWVPTNPQLFPDLFVRRGHFGFYAECKSAGLNRNTGQWNENVAYNDIEYEYHRRLCVDGGNRIALVFRDGAGVLWAGWLMEAVILAGPGEVEAMSGSQRPFYLIEKPRLTLAEWAGEL